MDYLRECPFQNEGETHDVRFVELKPGYGQIGCADCGFWFPSDEMVTKEEAYKRWNTRAKRTCRFVRKSYEERFACSNCEIEVGSDECENIPPFINYCPNCGARVVE